MGTLYIVSTPIGNLDDITVRARSILSSVDCIYAEDTRVSIKLLNHLQISKPLRPYHDFNKEKATPAIIRELQEGASVAVISDAGTPGIADPAFYLVRQALAQQQRVVPVPGPCAVTAALVASGLPTDRFVFENFLPHSSAKRKKIFAGFQHEKRTVLFYETPHRILAVLKEMHEVLGDVQVVIARELTKIYEEFLRGTPQSLVEHFTRTKPRGEMVVLFNNNPKLRKNAAPQTGAADAPEHQIDGRRE